MTLSKEKQDILLDDCHNIQVVAGPGSGKTRLIIEKVARLVKEGISPNKILIITYTNKAAEDLERRISKKIKEKGFYVSTFHGFCARFMQENNAFFKKFKGYKVLDELGQLLFIVKWINLIRTSEVQQIKPLDLRNFFGRIKDNYSGEESIKFDHPIKQSYINYCNKLKEQKRMDFGDIINYVVEEISKSKTLQNISNDKFDYIFIDEYQDINQNQFRLVKSFFSSKTKIMVVGDKNQSIYGFRGSDTRIFDLFEKSFENTKVYPLVKNYRSTQKIIEFSNRYMNLNEINKIIGNFDQSDGDLTQEGQKITIKEYPDAETEAFEIISKLKKLKEQNKILNYSDIAILLRSVKGDSARFIKVLKKFNIPYEVIGDGGLFELDYIKELLLCYKQLGNEHIIKSDYLGININKDELSDKIEKGPLAILYGLIEKSHFLMDAIKNNNEEVLSNIGKLSKIILTYCENFGFDKKGEYLATFYNALSRMDSEFLDTEQPNIEYNNSVKILTLHKSKGLEFPLVIIPGVNKDNYKMRSGDFISELFDYYSPKDDMKRAFYVAITRAKQKLMISYFDNPAQYIGGILNQEDLVFYEKYNQSRLFGNFSEDIVLNSTTPEKETLELTYYKLIEFWKCPFAYKLRFHNNLLFPRTFMFTYGSILHSLLSNLNALIKNKEKYDLDKLIQERVPDYLNRVNFKALLQGYISEFKDEIQEVVAVEMPFEFALGDSVINGRIDLIIKDKNGNHTIIEFKSGPRKKGICESDSDYLNYKRKQEEYAKKQLNLYALSLQNNYNIINGIIYFFGQGGKKVKFKIEKKQTELEIYDATSKIISGKFEKNTKSCGDCIFKEYPICPYLDNKNPNCQRDSDEEDAEMRDICCEL